MYRKIIIIAIITMFEISFMAKATVILLLSGLSSFYSLKFRPFIISSLNDLENRSNLCSLITIYAGLFYITIENDFAKFLIFLVIILFNINFFYIWLKSLLIIVFSSQLEKFYRLFPNFFTKLWAFQEGSKKLFIKIYNYFFYFFLSI